MTSTAALIATFHEMEAEARADFTTTLRRRATHRNTTPLNAQKKG